MIRNKIKEICENADKFEDEKDWCSYSCRFVYKNVKIEIEFCFFFGYQSLELNIKNKEYHSFESEDEIKYLSKEEKNLIYKTFKKQKRLQKKLIKERKVKEVLEGREKENKLLELIKF